MADAGEDIDLNSLSPDEQLAYAIQESLVTYGHENQVQQDSRMAQVLEESLDQAGRNCRTSLF